MKPCGSYIEVALNQLYGCVLPVGHKGECLPPRPNDPLLVAWWRKRDDAHYYRPAPCSCHLCTPPVHFPNIPALQAHAREKHGAYKV